MEAAQRHICLILFSIFSIYCCFSQNLVPNPSFEEYTICPEEVQRGWLECVPWQNGNCATVDYYNVCATNTYVQIPENRAGRQEAHSGNGYIGFIGKWSIKDWQEYPQIKLTEPCTGGYYYNISFYVSLADNYCGIPNIGAYLSVNPPDSSYCGPIDAVPQFEYKHGYINDKENWVLISGRIFAHGGEEWLTIGNFYDHPNTPVDPNCSSSTNSYYYLDDVCLSRGIQVEDTTLHDIKQVLCQGESLEVNGTEYNETNPEGTEVIFDGGVNGCDSIIIVQLSFNPSASSTISDTLCSGEYIQINGNIYDESHPVGSETINGGNVFGCDSVVNIQLSFLAPAESEINQTLCKGEWITVNGTMYDENHSSGVEVIPNAAKSGCDSIVVVNLSFYPEAHEYIIDTLEAGESIIINRKEYSQSNPSAVEVIKGGSVTGCDSIITIALQFRKELSAIVQTVAPICHGDSTGQIIVEQIAGGNPPYLVSIDGESQLKTNALPLVLSGRPAGPYTLIVEDESFNTIVFHTDIPEAPKLDVDAGIYLQVKEGKDVQLHVDATFDVASWSWSPVDFLSCTDCPDPIALQPDRDIIYTITATSELGCDVIDKLKITLLPEEELYAPTVFSPNGDGVNDAWKISSGDDHARLISLQIFDRWGSPLFSRTNIMLNEAIAEWDGRSRDEWVESGVYVFLAEVGFSHGERKRISGDVTVLR